MGGDALLDLTDKKSNWIELSRANPGCSRMYSALSTGMERRSIVALPLAIIFSDLTFQVAAITVVRTPGEAVP